jgi:CubicO group peptidase (beta-lactamase class C family)
MQSVAEESAELVRELYDGALRPDVAARTLRRSERLLPSRSVRRGTDVRALPPSSRRLGHIRFTSGERSVDLVDYLALNRVAGFLVLKDGAVVLEDYELALDPAHRWASFSIAKSVTSTLVGAALADGLIASIADPVRRYLPSLAGSAYDSVTVRDLLQMTSGVRWDETYTDPRSDRRQFLDLQLAARPGALLAYMGSLPRAAAPGSVWNYSTGETFLAGAAVEAATHRPLADYLSDKIWARAGMEAHASWWVETPDGTGIGGSGLGATLRDYGRFALFVLDDGMIAGCRIVPAGWFAAATAPRTIGNVQVDYGYLWWPVPKSAAIHDGAFAARGIFGQSIYINPREQLAIVVLSARPKPSGGGVIDDDALFAAVAEALA